MFLTCSYGNNPILFHQLKSKKGPELTLELEEIHLCEEIDTL